MKIMMEAKLKKARREQEATSGRFKKERKEKNGKGRQKEKECWSAK